MSWGREKPSRTLMFHAILKSGAQMPWIKAEVSLPARLTFSSDLSNFSFCLPKFQIEPVAFHLFIYFFQRIQILTTTYWLKSVMFLKESLLNTPARNQDGSTSQIQFQNGFNLIFLFMAPTEIHLGGICSSYGLSWAIREWEATKTGNWCNITLKTKEEVNLKMDKQSVTAENVLVP